MNFIEICKRVDTMSGVQGMIESVDNAIGAQAVIVDGVAESFVDLQNDRLNWEFMLRTVDFGTIPDKNRYEIKEIFTYQLATGGLDPFDATAPYVKFGRWRRDHPYTSYYVESYDDQGNRLTRKRMRYMDYQEFRELYGMGESSGEPSDFSYDPSDNSVLLHPTPDDRYFIFADYYVAPQILTHNAEVPILPEPFHMLLVYSGLDRLANHYSNPSIYNRYALAHAKMMGPLYREHVPGAYATIAPVA